MVTGLMSSARVVLTPAVSQLHDVHAKHLLPGFDDMEGESEQEVEIITNEISRVSANELLCSFLWRHVF